MSRTFSLRIEPLSDWHVGSGRGEGTIDRVVLLDDDGLPTIRGKALRALWRDHARQLAHGLDDGGIGAWSALVESIFGDEPASPGYRARRGSHDGPPRPAALSIGPARLEPALRLRLAGDDADRRLLRRHLSYVPAQTAVDFRSGSARRRTLRRLQRVRAGLPLVAEADLRTDDETCWHLLVASSLLFDRIGHKRRRGWGRTTIRIEGADAARSVEWLRRQHAAGVPAVPTVEAVEPPAPGSYSAASEPWRTLPLRLHLEQPVIVPARVVGNVVETRTVIPGTYLLGPMARALRQAGVADPDRHIQAGAVVVLSATPEVAGQRSLPAPSVVRMHKEGGDAVRPATLVNRLVEVSPGVQLRGWRGDFVTLPGDDSLPAHRSGAAGIGTAMHNSVDDAEQRAKEAGGVYTYQYLAAGQTYRTELRWRKDLIADEATLVEALPRSVRLGISRRDDYGGARLEPVGAPAPHAAPAVRTIEAAGRRVLPVWLASDVLLRDETLRAAPTVEALRVQLEGALAVRLQPIALDDRITVDCRTVRYESWHDGWSLPRPSLVALAAGSCVAFAVDGAMDPARLDDVAAGGFGERRAEGYGQLVLGAALLCDRLTGRAVATVPPADAAPSTALPALDGPSNAAARLVTRAAWMAEIERVALASMADGKMANLLLDADRNALQPGDLANLRGALRAPDLDALGAQREIAAWAARLLKVAERKNRKTLADLESHFGPDGGLREILDDAPGVARFWHAMTRERREPFAGLPMRLPVLDDSHRTALREELFPVALRLLLEASIRRMTKDRQGREHDEVRQ
jgi:CRISPR-associated protein Csx10